MAQHAGACFANEQLRPVLPAPVFLAQLLVECCLLPSMLHHIQYTYPCAVQGAKRLQAEFKYLTKQIAAGTITQMHDLTPVADNIFKWQACD